MRFNPRRGSTFADWEREQMKDIKFRAAYNALAEEFARAKKKIRARRAKYRLRLSSANVPRTK